MLFLNVRERTKDENRSYLVWSMDDETEFGAEFFLNCKRCGGSDCVSDTVYELESNKRETRLLHGGK